ncbi:hypothetical protein NGRA_0876 [Nosema granulosis]|uniref:Uncharacterized protein n=1 Tax=Nosema granulosis TaxID=83296 RepID=A0A9P6H171_9MICR|nr:hypothetical protein NGRA_0876 [Nosema granulosis]
MKYELNITGEFTNIQGMSAEELTFPAKLRCPSCNEAHAKVVVLTDESSKSEKRVYKCNFEMSCKFCAADLQVTVKLPEKTLKKTIKDYYGDAVEVEYSPINVGGCTVAVFETNGAIIEEIKDVSLNILTEDDRWFEKMHADESRTVTGEYPPNKIFSIVNYKNEVKQVKK